jgi:hypothetical protein
MSGLQNACLTTRLIKTPFHAFEVNVSRLGYEEYYVSCNAYTEPLTYVQLSSSPILESPTLNDEASEQRGCLAAQTVFRSYFHSSSTCTFSSVL